jgi:Mrp family chromosome partitioning ATPase
VELSFVISAIRRRWWLVVIFAVLGALAARELSKPGITEYEANAVLLVQPPTGTNVGFNDPDRYVESQLSALNSTDLAARVASEIPGESTDSIRQAIRIVQRPKTDVVDIFATAQDPVRAQNIANRYASLYITDLRERATNLQGAEVQRLDEKIVELTGQITEAANNLALDDDNPAALALQATALAQYDQVLQQKSQLELAATNRVTSEIVEQAVLPSLPTTEGGKLYTALGFFGGAVLGVAAAIVAARSSSKVLDSVELDRELGVAVVGQLSRMRALGPNPLSAFDRLPDAAAPVIDQLCVRAEALAHPGAPLTVAVVGSQRPAGVTTVAMAMAGRFARTGSRVVLIDGDQNDPGVSQLFGTWRDGGIPALLAEHAVADAREQNEQLGTGRRSERRKQRSIFTHTSLPEVQVLGLGDKGGSRPLARTNIGEILEASIGPDTHVVVVDGGPLLDSATTVQLCQIVDAIVLAVPIRRQRKAGIDVVKRLIGEDRRARVLPIATYPKRSHRSYAATQVSATIEADEMPEARYDAEPAVDTAATEAGERASRRAAARASRARSTEDRSESGATSTRSRRARTGRTARTAEATYDTSPTGGNGAPVALGNGAPAEGGAVETPEADPWLTTDEGHGAAIED